MQSDQFQGGQSPFLEQIDTSLFFPSGDRETVRNEIVKAIRDGVAIVTLVGDEGSGKSHLCQVILEDIPKELFPVYLPESLESYEDVIRIVAQELDISLRDQEEFGGTVNLLQAILGILKERGEKLLLIYDQAEKIYLATLERIRKMLDQANGEEVNVQVLLSGRTALLDNLQQLTLCTFEGTQERHFTLRPLSANETYGYLNFCMQKDTAGQDKEVFSREATEKIYSMANGNFRMTNILAEEALQSLGSDTSFMVLLENVGGNDSGSAGGWKAKVRSFNPGAIGAKLGPLFSSMAGLVERFRGGMPVSFKELLAQKEWLVAAGGGCVVMLILLMMVLGGDEEEMGQIAQDDPMNIEFKNMDEAREESDYQPPAEEPLPEELPEPRVVEAQAEKVEEEPVEPIAETPKPEMSEQKVQVVEDPAEETGVVEVPVEQPVEEIAEEPVAVEEPAIAEVVESEVDEVPVVKVEEGPKPKPVPEPASESAVAVSEVPATQTDEVKESADVDEEPATTIRVEPLTSVPAKHKIPVLGGLQVSKKIQKESSSLVSKVSVDKIYARRIVASAKWWVGEQEGQYTIQLMALTSDQAEKNLKKILDNEQYRGVSNELYILRRTTAPLSVLVFYGEYKTMGEARNASRDLPGFLKKHQPYAISVAGAVKKASSG